MFEQIKKDSPDAFKVWNNYISKYDQLWDLKPLESVIGWLLTFFDEQGIHIVIEYVCRLLSGGACYRYEVNSSRTSDRRVTLDWFKSRLEAWQSAIPKAFEILQKQLEEK